MGEYDDGFTTTTRSNVVTRLREEILSGRVPHGTRLRQAEVAARFGISTTPVREAFRELATLGLVEIQAHRGAVVHRLSSQERTQIYEVRILVEPVSVAWSAPLITGDVIEEAHQVLKAMREIGNPDAAAAMNRKFHSLIVSACGNDQLRDLVINLLDLSTPYIVQLSESSRGEAERQAAEHEQILLACERGDPAEAYRASLHHLAHRDGDWAASSARWLPFDLQSLLAAGPEHALPEPGPV